MPHQQLGGASTALTQGPDYTLVLIVIGFDKLHGGISNHLNPNGQMDFQVTAIFVPYVCVTITLFTLTSIEIQLQDRYGDTFSVSCGADALIYRQCYMSICGDGQKTLIIESPDDPVQA